MPFNIVSEDFDPQKTIGSAAMVKKKSLSAMFIECWDDIPGPVRTPLGKNRIKGADKLTKLLDKALQEYNKDSEPKASHAIVMIKSKKLHVVLLKGKSASKKNAIGTLKWGAGDGSEESSESSAPTVNPRSVLEAWIANATPETRNALMDVINDTTAKGILSRIQTAARKNRSLSGARSIHDACEIRLSNLEPDSPEDDGESEDTGSVPGFSAYEAWAAAEIGGGPATAALLAAINAHTDGAQLKNLAGVIKSSNRGNPEWVKLTQACKARFAALKAEPGATDGGDAALEALKAELQDIFDSMGREHAEFNKLIVGLRGVTDPLGQAVAKAIGSELKGIFVPAKAAIMDLKLSSPETAPALADKATRTIDGITSWLADGGRGRALQQYGSEFGASFDLRNLNSALKKLKVQLAKYAASARS